MAIIRPVVECNRIQIDNGRTYLRELIFGDPEEPHHRDALALTAQTEEEMTAVFRRDDRIDPGDAATLARVATAIMFIGMASPANIASTVDDIVQEIRDQVPVLLPR